MKALSLFVALTLITCSVFADGSDKIRFGDINLSFCAPEDMTLAEARTECDDLLKNWTLYDDLIRVNVFFQCIPPGAGQPFRGWQPSPYPVCQQCEGTEQEVACVGIVLVPKSDL